MPFIVIGHIGIGDLGCRRIILSHERQVPDLHLLGDAELRLVGLQKRLQIGRRRFDPADECLRRNLNEIDVDLFGLHPVEIMDLLIGHHHGIADQILHPHGDQHLPLHLLELIRGHLVRPEGLFVDPLIESAVALKARIGENHRFDVLIGHPDVHHFGLLQDDGLVDQVIERLLLEVQALEHLIRQPLAESLAVHIDQVLIFPLKFGIDDRLTVDHRDPLRPFPAAHRTEIKDKNDDDDPQDDLHEPVSGMLSHEVEH